MLSGRSFRVAGSLSLEIEPFAAFVLVPERGGPVRWSSCKYRWASPPSPTSATRPAGGRRSSRRRSSATARSSSRSPRAARSSGCSGRRGPRPHLGELRLGLERDGETRWLDEEPFSWRQEYVEGASILRTVARDETCGSRSRISSCRRARARAARPLLSGRRPLVLSCQPLREPLPRRRLPRPGVGRACL